MQVLSFPSTKSILLFRQIDGWPTLRAALDQILDGAELPHDRSARILLKPNLNNDLNGLTGNSTDLRLLRALIEALQARGYRSLTIGDGPNFGLRRLEIDVFCRLAVDRLAKLYGVECVDLNYDAGRPVELVNGRTTHIAATCLEADYVINLPKLKTHAEAGLSLACKNLIGCNVGINKKRVHDDLPRAIVRLGQILRPQLHIVDGLVAMEGNGPGDGLPRELGLLFAGRDPLLLDAAVARLVGIAPDALPHLVVARQERLIGAADWEAVRALTPLLTLLPAPPRRLVTQVLTRNSLTWLRDLARPLFSSRPVIRLLHRLRIVQDIYETADAEIERLFLSGGGQDAELNRLSVYCPMELDIARFRFDTAEERCIGCLYCYWLSPNDLIRVDGDLGYLKTHLDRYKTLVRERVGELWTRKGRTGNDERIDA
jgi:uncharacterized protein (DUF362 family)